MDEALRRAYLAAMDIPLWIHRDAVDPFALPAAPQPPGGAQARAMPVAGNAAGGSPVPVPGGAEARVPRQGRALLGDPAGASRPQAPREAAPVPVRQAPRIETAADGPLRLRFARSRGAVFVDEASAPGAGSAVAELIAALAFVLDRQKQSPEVQRFEWPPRGVPYVAPEARDAVLARIAKLGGPSPGALVLLGARPACLLLGWDAAHWASRDAAPRHLEGLACPVWLLPAAEDMLRDPALKRVAWQTLRLAARADA